jgi:hypothetical protein
VPNSNEQPASKQDLIDMEARMEARMMDRVQEIVRDAQTEILRGFERYSRSQDIRMRKMEADVSNLNTSESLRIAMLEERVTWIEQKLIGGDPQRPH